MPCSCWVISSMPGGAMISTPIGMALSSISISRSSSSCSRSILRKRCRVSLSRGVASGTKPAWARGRSTSRTRSSALSAARWRTLVISSSRVIFTEISTRSRTIESTSRPTYPTSVNLVASTLMNGALASRAKRRAISVLPTPVGPIMRMFFGVISGRSASATWLRPQRFRKAIATARLAAFWPTICLSSSSTISRGVICDMGLQLLDRQIAIRVDADVRGNIERAFDDVARGHLSLHEGQRRGLREASPGADGNQIMLRFDHVAIPRYDVGAFRIRDAQQRFEPAQASVGAPVLGQFDGGTGQIAVFLELCLEALEQRESIGGAARKAGKHFTAVQAAYLAGIALHDALPQGHLSVAADGHLPMAPHGQNRGSVDSLGIVSHRKPEVGLGGALSSAAAARARMRSLVHACQVLKIKVGIDLGCANIRVTEQFLHAAQITARLEQVRGE